MTNDRGSQAGRQQLCDHPDFRLVHVSKCDNDGDDDGVGSSSGSSTYTMEIIRPSVDTQHRERIEAQGYYALSHLWGNAKEFPYWDVSDMMTERGAGRVAPVPMRPEKRDTLVGLLKAHPDSYWWIDVLCARVDTPLMIMGSIYRHCDECIALFDLPPPSAGEDEDMSLDQVMELSRSLSACAAAYYHANHLLRRRPNLTETKIRSVIERRSSSLVAIEEQFGRVFQWMLQIVESCWFTRVWTSQEFVLPPRFTVMSEQCAPANIQLFDFAILEKVVKQLDAILGLMDNVSRLREDMGCLSLVRKLREKSALYDRSGQYEGVHDIYGQQEVKKGVVPRLRALPRLRNVFEALETSPRICAEPVDYVYGVIGMLELDIPRLQDPKDVWARFLQELSKLLTYLTEQDEGRMWAKVIKDDTFDLANAKNLGHVYGGLVKFSRRRNRKSKLKTADAVLPDE